MSHTLETMYTDAVDVIYTNLQEVLPQTQLPTKDALLAFMQSDTATVKMFVSYLMIIYSALAFAQAGSSGAAQQMEVKKIKIELKSKFQSHPLLQELSAIIYQMVTLKDINRCKFHIL